MMKNKKVMAKKKFAKTEKVPPKIQIFFFETWRITHRRTFRCWFEWWQAQAAPTNRSWDIAIRDFSSTGFSHNVQDHHSGRLKC